MTRLVLLAVLLALLTACHKVKPVECREPFSDQCREAYEELHNV